jgi:molecular chaperone DnaK
VTFDIDADGILNVSAEDKATGREQHITITASSGLSKDEVDQMVKDSKRYASEDRKRKEQIEARNAADTIIYQAEKTLREQGSAEEVRRRAQDLSDSLQKVGAAMYEQQAPPPPPDGEANGAPGSDEDVVEGEFREAE